MKFVVVLFVFVSACATTPPTRPSQRMRFLDRPVDYERLGLGDHVAPWEDGRRSTPKSDEYEWWYVDAVLDDGSIVVIWFGDNWLAGTHKRAVHITYTVDGKSREESYQTKDPGTFKRGRTDVRIGNNRFVGDLNNYQIVVDEGDTGGIGCELNIRRRSPAYRPGTGYMGNQDQYFAWLVAVPEGEVEGTLVVDGKRQKVHGSAYHDHNWGNVPPWDLMRNWWWGRAAAEGRTVIMADLRPHDGGASLPLLYIADDSRSIVDAYGAAVAFSESDKGDNGEPRKARTLANRVRLRAQGTDVTITRSPQPIGSTDLLQSKPPLVALLARVLGRSPWYLRYDSRVVLTTGKENTSGVGTLEFMDFE